MQGINFSQLIEMLDTPKLREGRSGNQITTQFLASLASSENPDKGFETGIKTIVENARRQSLIASEKMAEIISILVSSLILACDEELQVPCLDMLARPFIDKDWTVNYIATNECARGVFWGILRAPTELYAPGSTLLMKQGPYRRAVPNKVVEILKTQISAANETVSVSARSLGNSYGRSNVIREIARCAKQFADNNFPRFERDEKITLMRQELLKRFTEVDQKVRASIANDFFYKKPQWSEVAERVIREICYSAIGRLDLDEILTLGIPETATNT